MKPLGFLPTKWTLAGLGKALTRDTTDIAAMGFMMRLLPQLIADRQYEQAADGLLDFIESGDCSQRVQELSEEWVSRMVNMLNSERHHDKAREVAHRLANAKAHRAGFKIPALG